MSRLPSKKKMHRAVCERDAGFEGLFFVGVTTTGIFCRPTCGAKKPKFENTVYFATPSDSLLSGFRPCKRCRPMDGVRQPSEQITRLQAAVELNPTRRWTDSDLDKMGVEPSTARRQFRRYYGMTFHAYQRKRRMGLALRALSIGKKVIDVQTDHGYESASGFRDAFGKLFGAAPDHARTSNCLIAQRLQTPLGLMVAVVDGQGVCLLEFVDRRGLEREVLDLRRRVGVIVPGDHHHLAVLKKQLADYFSGKNLRFDIPLHVVGSPFEQSVWRELERIGPGGTKSYAEIASAVGHPKASRAIGRANGANRIALIIPCHRVIRSDGELCGYGGGIWRKHWLLEHEKRHAGRRAPAPPSMIAAAGTI